MTVSAMFNVYILLLLQGDDIKNSLTLRDTWMWGIVSQITRIIWAEWRKLV